MQRKSQLDNKRSSSLASTYWKLYKAHNCLFCWARCYGTQWNWKLTTLQSVVSLRLDKLYIATIVFNSKKIFLHYYFLCKMLNYLHWYFLFFALVFTKNCTAVNLPELIYFLCVLLQILIDFWLIDCSAVCIVKICNCTVKKCNLIVWKAAKANKLQLYSKNMAGVVSS